MTTKKNINISIVKIFIVLFAFIGTQNIVYSQKPQYTEEITIIGSYKPSIQDSYRINTNPVINDLEKQIPKLSYSITSTKAKTTIVPKDIDHERTIRKPKQKLLGNYVKIGFGNYKTPYLEFFANTLQSKKFALGVHLKHLSSMGEIKNHPLSTFSNSLAGLSVKKLYKKHTLSGELSYKHDVVHYYNLEQNVFDSLDWKDDKFKQRFQLFKAKLGLNSNYNKKGKLNHSFDFNYYYLTDYYSTSEQNAFFKTNININFELFNSKDIQRFGVLAEIDAFINKDSLTENMDQIARIQPYIKATFGKYRVYFGINTTVPFDTTKNISLFPIIKAEVEVVPKSLIAYIGTKGNHNKNSFKILYEQNPFISSIMPLEYSKNKFEVYGGIMGNIENIVNYSFMISSSKIENMPFFVNDTNGVLLDKFSLVYDTADIIHVQGEISYQSKDNLRIILKGDYYNFELENELQPWYRPQLEASIGFNVTVLEKLILKGSFGAYSKMYSNRPEVGEITPKEIDGWVDLSFGVEYKFSQKLSAFVNLNNVMNSQYKKWDNYPLQKFNFLGGLTYSF